MEMITHREMRNNSSDLLRRVEAGESVVVSNHGRPVALIGPMPANTLAGMIQRGLARRAQKPASSLAEIRRRASDKTSSAILDDLRGSR